MALAPWPYHNRPFNGARLWAGWEKNDAPDRIGKGGTSTPRRSAWTIHYGTITDASQRTAFRKKSSQFQKTCANDRVDRSSSVNCTRRKCILAPAWSSQPGYNPPSSPCCNTQSASYGYSPGNSYC